MVEERPLPADTTPAALTGLEEEPLVLQPADTAHKDDGNVESDDDLNIDGALAALSLGRVDQPVYAERYRPSVDDLPQRPAEDVFEANLRAALPPQYQTTAKYTYNGFKTR